MPAKLGLDAKLYRNTGTYAAPTWDLIGNVRDLTLNLETGEADVSTRSNNGWRATVSTLKDASLEFEMVWDTADSDFGAIRDAFLNNTTVEIAVMDGLITGAVTRHEIPGLPALCFTLEGALLGGVTISAGVDPHGKSLSFALLAMDVPPPPEPLSR